MKKHYSLFLVFLFVVIFGCSSDLLDVEENVSLTKGVGGNINLPGPSGLTNYADGQTVLGNEVPEVYSVSAMRSAYQARYPNGGQYGLSGVKTTHYYVRFLPKTEEEFYSIDHLDLSTLPFHKEITQGGSSYHDPSIPEGQYSWQYAIIPVNQLITTVEYEILEELFFVDEKPNGLPGIPGPPGPGGATMSYDFWKTLTESSESMAAGGSGQAGPPGWFTWWYPSGKIVAYDDFLNDYLPVVDAEVVIWHGTRKARVKTDMNGEFTSSKNFLTDEVYYRLNWEGDDYIIYEKAWPNNAFMCNGKRISGPWNVTIRSGDNTRKQLAAMYRACERTYKKDYLFLDRPDFSGRIAISYVDGAGSSLGRFRGGFVTDHLFPAIKIWSIYNGQYRTSDQIFGTTIHELAHANHYKKAGFTTYLFTSDNISESWARAVQYYVTKKEYEEHGKDVDEYETYPLNGGITYGIVTRYLIPKELNVQTWPYEVASLEYSSLIIDLVDYNNQMGYYKETSPNDKSYRNYPNDNVNGFSLYHIQSVLNDAVSVGSFKTAIKNLNKQYYSNKNTNVQIDSLFKRYEQRWK